MRHLLQTKYLLPWVWAGVILLLILPILARAAQVNLLMTGWLRSFPAVEAPGVFWMSDPRRELIEKAGLVANGIGTGCEKRSTQQRVCRLNSARAVSANDDNGSEWLDDYGIGSTEQIILASIAGDVAYAHGDDSQAFSLWKTYFSQAMLLNKAQAAVTLGDMEMADQLIDEMELPGTLHVSQRNRLAAVLAALAVEETRRSNFDKAEEYWRLAIEQVRDHDTYHFGLCGALRAQQEWQQAARSCQRAIEHDPGEVRNYIRLAEIRIHLGQMEEASSLLQKAQALAPDDKRVEALLETLQRQHEE